jgi:hypothetical protein
MEAYNVHLAKGIRIFGQGYALRSEEPKHTLVQISLYPWLNGHYMLPY